MITCDLVQTLLEMNDAFGKGDITFVNINMDESNPHTGMLHGTVIRRFPSLSPDVRFWKCDGKTVTFLSHKRVLYTSSGRK